MSELKYKINQMFIAGIDNECSEKDIDNLLNNYIGNFIVSYGSNTVPEEIYKFNKNIFEKTADSLGIEPFIAIENKNVLTSSAIITGFPNKAATIAGKIPLSFFREALYNAKELSALGFGMSLPEKDEYASRTASDDEFNYYYERISAGHKNSFIFCIDIKQLLNLNSFEKHRFDKNPVTDKIPAVIISQPDYRNFTPQMLSNTLNIPGFSGIIINNLAENKKLKEHYSIKDILLNGIISGANMFIAGSGSIPACSKIISDAVRANKISEKLIDESFKRIKKIKNDYRFAFSPFEYTKKIINHQKHIKLSHEISQKSVSRISGNSIDIHNIPHHKTAVVAPYSTPNNLIDQINPFNVDFSFFLSHKYGFHPFHYLYNFNRTYIDSLIKSLEKYEYVIYAVNDIRKNKNQLDLYNRLVLQNKKIIAVSLSECDLLPEEPYSHYCIYEYTPLSIRSLCKVFSGIEPSAVI